MSDRLMFLVLESEVEVREHPDSGKIGACSGHGPSRMRHLTHASDARDHGENE